MKKQEFLNKLSELTHIDVETMTKLISSEQEEIELPEIKTENGDIIDFNKIISFSNQDLNARDIRMASAGNKTAVEQYVKGERDKLVKKYGEEFFFEGKILDNLVETAINIGVKQSGVEPGKKIEEKEKIIKQLQTTVTTLESERDAAINDKKQLDFRHTVNSTLRPLLKGIEGPFSEDDIITIWERDHEPVLEDGVLTFKKNGEVVRDKTQSPILLTSGFETFLSEKGMKMEERKGRGIGDSGNNGSKLKHADIKNADDFYKYAKENNIENDNEAQKKLLKEIQKENPQFSLLQ